MNKRYVFFGTDSFVVPVLEALLALPYECVGVVTAQDKLGRKGKRIPSPIKLAAEKHVKKVYTPEKLKDFFSTFQELAPDFCVIASYGKIIPQKFIDLPSFGILNIHPSFLPRHRGPSPVPATILASDTKTGVAIMKIDAGVDTGALLAQEEVQLTGRETSPQLLDQLFHLGSKLLQETLPKYLEGKLAPIPQSTTGVTHSALFKKEDGKLNFEESASVLERKVRALNPWPGTFVTLGGQKIKILSVEVVPTLKKDTTPGTISIDNKAFLVACDSGTLKILALQPEGKNQQKADEFLRGHNVHGQKFA